MNYQRLTVQGALVVAILVVFKASPTLQQDQQCHLPDGKRISTCIRLHYCNTFQQTLRQYGSSRPPMDVVQNINAHVCASGGFVCCPDNAKSAPTPATTLPPSTQTPVTTQDADGLPGKSDLQYVKSHSNFNLINERSCGTTNVNRIVGGMDAELYEIPWAVLLGYQLLDGFKWQCGGSLISKKFVLTAAHCLTRELVSVRVGEHQISTNPDCDAFESCADPVQDIQIERKIKHPKYRASRKVNDIALLKLKEPADTTRSNIRTICLPTDADADLEKVKSLKKPLTIFGWGKIGNGRKDISDVLQKAYLPFVDHQECVSKFKPYNIAIHQTYLCAGGHNKTDSCRGDSGGGITSLATIGGKAKVILYGVVSGGIECENPNLIFPGIYTNIQNYLDWILDNMTQ